MATRKKAAPAGPLPDDLVERDFVYMGVREGQKGKLIKIGLIGPDGELETRLYAFDKNRTIGGIYKGVKFNATQSLGLDLSRYTGDHWKSDSDIIEWTADHRLTLQAMESAKFEKEAGRVDRIEELLLPLRIEYAKAHDRFDSYKARALEDAVKTALRTPPRQYELDKKNGR